MTRVKRLLRDKAVLGGIGLLLVFAIVSSAFVISSGRTQAADERQAAAAREQVQRAAALSAQTQLLIAGNAEVRTNIEATLSMFERTHHGLRSGDNGLDLPSIDGPDIAVQYTALDTTFSSLTGSVRDALNGSETQESDVANDAAVYQSRMSRIASALGSDAANGSVLNQQIQLVTVTIGFSLAIMVLMVAAHRRQKTQGASTRPAGPGDLDQLTGLVKRRALRDHLIDAIHRRPPSEGFVALLILQIRPEDRDLPPLGRRAQDRMTQEAAHRIRSSVRSTDLVARTARDEFAVVMDRSPRVDDPGRVAVKLISALDADLSIDGSMRTLRPAVGIAIAPIDALSGDELLEKATAATRIALERPAPTYRYYSPDHGGGGASKAQLAQALRDAIGDPDQLWLAYQPKIRLRDRAVVGFEALLRWDHPSMGPISPTDFIAIAEESDLIYELGSWVVDEVCSQLAAWRGTGAPTLPVSINVSTRQFRHGDLGQLISVALDRHDLRPNLIEVEITEGVLIDEQEHPLSHMQELQDLGIKISVDDFGTGYSSLSYLKRFPIDTLKIDRSFISELSADNDDAAIATAIIALAHSLELDVVAEGVESEEQLQILIQLGCDSAQGFLFSEPVEADTAARFVRHKTREVSAGQR